MAINSLTPEELAQLRVAYDAILDAGAWPSESGMKSRVKELEFLELLCPQWGALLGMAERCARAEAQGGGMSDWQPAMEMFWTQVTITALLLWIVENTNGVLHDWWPLWGYEP